MNYHELKSALAGLLATATLGFAQVSSETEPASDVVELSPFTVEDTRDSGYVATATLAASRIRSELRDLGNSVSITTKDFLDDTGATDGESLLALIGNVEVGGVLGNFANVSVNDDTNADNSTNGVRNNPQGGQRVRGLVSASTTRDYFQTNIPFDSYNTSRVEVNRGPNSILFGLGSPGGIINNSTNRARLNERFGEVGFRVDSRGGYRATFDFNETVVEDRFALRVNLMDEQINFKQDPAFENDTRYYGAFDLTLRKDTRNSWLGRTSLRGSFESGEIERNPPDTVPPLDGFSSWYIGLGGEQALLDALAVPGTTLEKIDTANRFRGAGTAVAYGWVLSAINQGLVTVPEGMTAEQYASAFGRFVPNTPINRITNEGLDSQATFTPYFLYPAVNFNSAAAGTEPGWAHADLGGVQGIMGRWRTRQGLQDTRWSAVVTAGPGFRSRTLQNRAIFDYHNNLFQGTTNRVFTDFDVAQLYLEQTFLDNKMGLEFAWNSQSRNQTSFNSFSSGRSKQISIDLDLWHAPADGPTYDGVPERTPNENFGRPVVRWDDNNTIWNWNDQETNRATLYGILDFEDFSDGWLGKALGQHNLTGLWEDRTNDNRFRFSRGAWWSDNPRFAGGGDISFWNNGDFRRIVKSQVYLGPDSSGLTDPNDLRLDLDGGIQVRTPSVGDRHGIWYWDNGLKTDAIEEWRIVEALGGADVNRGQLESTAFSLQSKILGGHLVGLYAVRQDEQTLWRRIRGTPGLGPTGSDFQRINDPGANPVDGNFNEALLFLEDEPFAIDKDDTTTWSVVGHYPESWLGDLPFGMNLSAHYYEAESFQPASGQVNIRNEPLVSPLGITKEWGATIELFDGRLSIRYNNFETVNANARTNLGFQVGQIVGLTGFFVGRIVEAEEGGVELFPNAEDALKTTTTTPSNLNRITGTDADLIGVNSWDEYYARLLDIMPPSVRDVYNLRVVRNADGTIDVLSDPLDGGLWATRDFVATGHEIDVSGKLSDNISVSLNVAQQKTVTSNTGPVAVPLGQEVIDRIRSLGLYDIRDSPFQGAAVSIGRRYEDVLRRLSPETALDGQVSPEQREWRVNLTTRYDFTEGRFNGLSVGGSLRYQSAVAAGYPTILDEFGNTIPDVANPHLGPEELNGDMFARYRTKLGEKIGWTIQLNARNLYRQNGNNDIPTLINPDGRIARIRIPNEQQFFLTNTFSF